MLEEARAGLLAVGDRERAAETDALLGELSWIEGRNDATFAHLERGHDLVRDAPPSPSKAFVLSQLARYRMLADDFDPELSREALELAQTLGLVDLHAHGLITIGTGRFKEGDPGGREEIEQGLELALRENLLGAAVRGYSNLASLDRRRRGPARRSRAPRGRGGAGGRAAGQHRPAALGTGQHDRVPRRRRAVGRVRAAAEAYLAGSDSFGPHYQDCAVLGATALIRLGRGDLEGALADQAGGARRSASRQGPAGAPTCAAHVLLRAGRRWVASRRRAVPFDELFSQRHERLRPRRPRDRRPHPPGQCARPARAGARGARVG